MTAELFETFVIAQRWGRDGHMDGGWWIFMSIGMILFWILVVLAIVWLVRSLLAGRPGAAAVGGGEPTALEILERRLADGSISVEEYEERRRVLSGTGPRDQSEER